MQVRRATLITQVVTVQVLKTNLCEAYLQLAGIFKFTLRDSSKMYASRIRANGGDGSEVIALSQTIISLL